VIMQRLHESDVSGVILDKRLGYDHIMLPMRYDPDRAMPTKLGLEDPRSAEGELLFPARFPVEVVDRDEAVMGPYAAAGQFQQLPKPRGGGIIQDKWWQLWNEDAFPPLDYVVASLDTAYTNKSQNDPSAMTVWGVFSQDVVAQAGRALDREGRSYYVERSFSQQHPKVMLLWAWEERLELHELIQKIEETSRRFPLDDLIIENKAAGHSISQELRRLHLNARFGVRLLDTGAQDKVARLYSVQHLFSEGLIYAPDRSWADKVIQQCSAFPKAKHDDLVDTVSQAMRYLRTSGLLQRSKEVQDDIDQQMQHSGSLPPPLYPV